VKTKPTKTGTFLRVPYDWRRPTAARVKSRWWNPNDPRVFTPKSFGWGYDVNMARLVSRQRNRNVIAMVVITFVAVLLGLLAGWKRKPDAEK
jgi:hypothetical protein